MEDDVTIRMHALNAASTTTAGKGYKYASIIKLADAYVEYIKTGVFTYEYAPPSYKYATDIRKTNARRDLEDRINDPTK